MSAKRRVFVAKIHTAGAEVTLLMAWEPIANVRGSVLRAWWGVNARWILAPASGIHDSRMLFLAIPSIPQP